VSRQPDRARFEALVEEWGGRIYNLAYRMTGHRADAEDAAQDVFLRLWTTLDRYDRARPFQPWIYRLATRAILNSIRARRRRDVRHREMLPREADAGTEVAVDRREREQVVHEALQTLDCDSRALVSLHYYAGLSQGEIAGVLDMPRTTVQSRLSKAVGSLRISLRNCGAFALVPGVEDLMRESVPLALERSTLTSMLGAVSSGTTSVATAGLVGGWFVNKMLVASAAGILFVGLAGGYALGRIAAHPPATPPERTAADVVQPGGAGIVLHSEPTRLRGPGATLASRETDAGTAVPDVNPGARASITAAPTPEASEAIDWSVFSELLASSADRLAAVGSDTSEDMTPEDQELLMKIYAEYLRVSIKARAQTPQPFFDEKVLPDFVVALFGKALGLTKDQEDDLRRASLTSLANARAALAVDTAMPLELLEARHRIAVDVMRAVGDNTTPSAKERLASLRSFADAFLQGSHREMRIGVSSERSGLSVADRVLARWKDTYELQPHQEERMRPIAERYVRDATDLLERRGSGTDSADDSVATRKDMDFEMLALQVACEREMTPMLSAEQRDAARKRGPSVVALQPGDGEVIMSSMSSGL
jgi:RNA polymerase sigma-70 factor, ECF subfamily